MTTNTQPRDNGRLIGGGILIALGFLFLAGQIFDIGDIMETFWPFFVIVPGLAFLAGAVMGDKRSAGLAVPGAMVTGTGLILLYQNLTDHWESWAYIWTLYPVFLGLAFNFMARRTDNTKLAQTGRGFVIWGLVGLIVLGAVFELFIFGGMGWLGNLLIPGAMIAAGVYLLMRNHSRSPVLVTNGSKTKRMTGPSAEVEPNLKRKIDEALAEEDQTV